VRALDPPDHGSFASGSAHAAGLLVGLSCTQSNVRLVDWSIFDRRAVVGKAVGVTLGDCQ
jgi:hypothetical protein